VPRVGAGCKLRALRTWPEGRTDDVRKVLMNLVDFTMGLVFLAAARRS
jgi:hypothetical protein